LKKYLVRRSDSVPVDPLPVDDIPQPINQVSLPPGANQIPFPMRVNNGITPGGTVDATMNGVYPPEGSTRGASSTTPIPPITSPQSNNFNPPGPGALTVPDVNVSNLPGAGGGILNYDYTF
jgi:hypothetical protein